MESKKLFLSNIPTWTEQTSLERIFSAYGDIVDVEIARNRVTNEALGYAIITYFSPQAAERALEKDGKVIGGKIVGVKLVD